MCCAVLCCAVLCCDLWLTCDAMRMFYALDTMDQWDQNKLEEVVNSKLKGKLPPTDIVRSSISSRGGEIHIALDITCVCTTAAGVWLGDVTMGHLVMFHAGSAM